MIVSIVASSHKVSPANYVLFQIMSLCQSQWSSVGVAVFSLGATAWSSRLCAWTYLGPENSRSMSGVTFSSEGEYWVQETSDDCAAFSTVP